MYKKYREDALSILPNFLCDSPESFVPPDELAGDAAQRRLPVGHSLHNHPVLAARAVPHGDAVFRQPLDLIFVLAVDAERLESLLAAVFHPFHIAENSGDDPDRVLGRHHDEAVEESACGLLALLPKRRQFLLDVIQTFRLVGDDAPRARQRIMRVNHRLARQRVEGDAADQRVSARLVFLCAPVVVGEQLVVGILAPPLHGEMLGIAVEDQRALVVRRLRLLARVVEHLMVVHTLYWSNGAFTSPIFPVTFISL